MKFLKAAIRYSTYIHTAYIHFIHLYYIGTGWRSSRRGRERCRCVDWDAFRRGDYGASASYAFETDLGNPATL